ncbi:MAG: imidazoleglycerol-phosphate dehydratase HisB [Candidatus Gastranaerophilales bacterium]|nr:imidazoleglycerol-phosphate dehydratase HisB [Candidatus Gastranaerophilales bacterium]
MRKSRVERKTNETEIKVDLNLDGTGIRTVNTGIKFFDHMLEQLAAHGFFDLTIIANSLDEDTHHVVEDVAITLGQAFLKALGDKKGIKRYGNKLIPMDEALTLTSVDISGRPYCNCDFDFNEEKVSDFETVLTKHFFSSFAIESKITLHIKTMYGDDVHHKIESIFKSFARALNQAVSIDEQHKDIMPSTKGML